MLQYFGAVTLMVSKGELGLTATPLVEVVMRMGNQVLNRITTINQSVDLLEAQSPAHILKVCEVFSMWII